MGYSKQQRACEHNLKVELLGYTLRRYYLDDFYTRHISKLPDNTMILDVGGAKTRKRGKFKIESYPVNVIYLNLTADKCPDILADAAAIPLQNNSFDVTVCADVLEHVPNPLNVLKEIYRVLRPEGTLLMSVPFMVWMHADPYDYGRYTDYYWKENLERLGFQEIQIEKQGLFWSVLVNILREFMYYHIVKQNRFNVWLVRHQIYRIIRWARQKAIACDLQPETQQHPLYRNFTTGFGIVAMKT